MRSENEAGVFSASQQLEVRIAGKTIGNQVARRDLQTEFLVGYDPDRSDRHLHAAAADQLGHFEPGCVHRRGAAVQPSQFLETRNPAPREIIGADPAKHRGSRASDRDLFFDHATIGTARRKPQHHAHNQRYAKKTLQDPSQETHASLSAKRPLRRPEYYSELPSTPSKSLATRDTEGLCLSVV